MGLSSNINDAFRKAFEQDCFELIIDGYSHLVMGKIIQINWMENDFSELLSSYINSGTLSAKKRILCKTENKLLQSNTELVRGFSDKLSRVDFIYSVFSKQQKFEYFMEAKRLKEKDSNLKREYIKEGMNRFISKKYPHGSMIGYLLEGKADETVKGINSLLIKDERNTEILNLTSNKLLKTYYESNHSGIGTLKHLIFDFTSISNTQAIGGNLKNYESE